MNHADRLESQARQAIDNNDVEQGWYLRGQADAIRGEVDHDAATDPLYGEHYRKGLRSFNQE